MKAFHSHNKFSNKLFFKSIDGTKEVVYYVSDNILVLTTKKDKEVQSIEQKKNIYKGQLYNEIKKFMNIESQ